MVRPIVLAVLCAALCLGAGASRAADPAPVAGSPGDGAITLTAPGHTVQVTEAMLAALPATKVPVASGSAERAFEGPLLWAVLADAAAIDPAQFHGHVRAVVVITGHDGYTAVLAMGELSPEFENKQVILATRMDGQPLGAGHLRVVVPGDKRGGRGVHDVAAISVEPRSNAVR